MALPPIPAPARRPPPPASRFLPRAAPVGHDPLGEGLGIGATHPTLPVPGTGYAPTYGPPPYGPSPVAHYPGWALRLWADLLPPPPSPDAFPAPALPLPPTVADIARTHGARDGMGLDTETGGVDPGRALAAFAHTYWSCVERGWGLPSQPRRRYVGSLTAPRRAALEGVARTLTTLGVKPAEWVALRFRAWQRCRVAIGGRKTPRGPASPSGTPGASGTTPPVAAPFPPFAWVMAAAAVERYAAEGASAEEAHAVTPHPTGTAPPILSAPVRGLLTAWGAARAALATLPAGSTREDAERAVRAHLGSWPARLAEAQEALDAEARAVHGLALRGEWVWPLPVNAIATHGGIGVTVAELAAEVAVPQPPPAVWSAVRDRALPTLPATQGAPTRATATPRAPGVARSAATVSRQRGTLPALPPLPTLPRR